MFQVEEFQAPTRRRYAALDGWRGVIATLAALHHFYLGSLLNSTPFLTNSFLVLDFFFVMSGFVIFRGFSHRLVDLPSSANFVLRRFGRLWPLHAAVLTGFLLLECLRWAAMNLWNLSADREAFSHPNTGYTFLLNLGMWHALGFEHSWNWNLPSWTVSTEFHAYLVFVGVVLLLKPRWHALGFLLVAVSGCLLVMRFSDSGMAVTTNLGFPRSLYGFSLGCLLAIYFDRLSAVLGSQRFCAMMEVVLLLSIFAFVMNVGRGPLGYLGPLLFALLILIYAHEHGPVSRLLKWAPVQLLALWSYAIYIVHFLVVEILRACVQVYERLIGVPMIEMRDLPSGHYLYDVIGWPAWAHDLLYLPYIVLVVMAARLLHRWVEEPCRLYFNNLAKARFEREVEAPVQRRI